MSLEDEYIKEQFVKNFIETSSRNVVIYGVGVHTQRLLENVSCDRIVGLMDAKTTGKIMWGKKVLSYDEVAAIPEVVIVILARNAVINVIYRRIESFVKEHNIKVFDINANDLSVNVPGDKEYQGFYLNEDELLGKLDKAQVITFDIFDTLISRWVLRPRDIFKLIDTQVNYETFLFSEKRIEAEDMAGDATIYQIYDVFRKITDISDEEKNRLLRLEIDTEKKYLHKRNYMCELLKSVVEKGKKVYLISDMYLTKDILEDILLAMGISGYEDIFVSCEYGKTKENGLFRVFLENTCYKPECCLHIGDNYYADIVAAKKSGMSVYQIYSPVDLLENSIYSVILNKCDTFEENVVISRFAVDAYNNPFGRYHKNGKLILESVEQMAGLLIAPVIYKYCVWITQQLVKNNNDIIYFPSRDGYILQKIYDMISEHCAGFKLPDSKYIYTSRRIALSAAVSGHDDIKNVLMYNDTRTLAESIKYRFEVDVDTNISWDDLTEIVLEKIYDRTKTEKEYYLRYLTENGIDSYKNIAFVDFVAIGTIQKNMEKLTNKKMQGYYLYKRRNDKKEPEKISFESLYPVLGDFDSNANVYKYYYFLEAIITSYEPSLKYITSDGKPVFYVDNRNDMVIDALKKVHSKLLSYSEDMLNVNENILNMTSGIRVYDEILGFFSADFSDIEDDRIIQFMNEDEFLGKMVTGINR